MPNFKNLKRSRAMVPYKKKKSYQSKKIKLYHGRVPRLPWSRNKGEYGFPPTLETTLKYVEDIRFTSALGAVTSNVFRFNSVFDPNETGVGHQPMYYDVLSTVYGRYVVTKARAKATFNVITETAATSLFTVGLIGQATGTIDTIPSANMEDNHSKYKLANGRNGGTGQQILYLDYYPQRDLNLSVNDDAVGSAIGTNPSVSYKLIPWVADLQATGSTVCVCVMEIEYTVQWSDAIFNVQS